MNETPNQAALSQRRSAPDADSRRSPRWLRKAVVALRRANFYGLLEIASFASLVGMVATAYLAFSNAPSSGALLPATQAGMLLVGTLIPAMALLVLAGRRMAIRRAAGSTARLHVRLVFFFSLIAAIPTLLVSAFAAFLFQSGVEFWFSDDSRGLMQNANRLAKAYYEDNQRNVGEETVAMAGDMRFYLERASITDDDFADYYLFQAQGREVSESAILQEMDDGSVRVAALFDLAEGNQPEKLAPEMFAQIKGGESVAVAASANRIEALAAIDRVSGIYLYNARSAEVGPFTQWERAQNVSTAYDSLTRRARALQLQFNLALFFVSLSLVGLAVWFALRFADRQVEPLTELVAAARRVGSGNFAMRVDGRTGADEIGLLNRAFNRMTAQIARQTEDLVSANTQIDQRRSFIEAVLESVTAGVISLNPHGEVLLINSTAQKLLIDDPDFMPVGNHLAEFAPQIDAMLDAKVTSGLVQHNKGNDLLTLAVKVTSATDGHVITFEDITSQLLDQRQAAWSDVARRIAHEIKNPLTPIQLATERLKRRYRRQIEADGDLFDELTNTIIRQVGDLRKMVDEFSSFARLPKPVFRKEDALDLVRQSLFLQEVGKPEIAFTLTGPDTERILIECDRHQFGQAMTNVLKNAAEAVEARANHAEPDFKGRIAVHVEASETMFTIAVSDNGIGLPKDSESILEPYMTTREKGTGLGLAIVNKIVEEHGGDMSFANSDIDTKEGGGTTVKLRFAREPAVSAEETAL
ncbi:ATP-binding protein [Altererythrobacter aquiaggeris]|uniref:sensor histidine kinase n=1 Tax=Aestuarierythrobacter aquiaggeris TaxID=1898396 RepID=UPI00301934D7